MGARWVGDDRDHMKTRVVVPPKKNPPFSVTFPPALKDLLAIMARREDRA